MNYWLAVILADMAIFYVGMRWAKLASKLFVIAIPLLLWSGTMIYEAAMAPSEGETAANFVPNCGNDEQCWQTFARQREQLRGGEMARLFAPTAAFFMTLALAVLLVRRARFARNFSEEAALKAQNRRLSPPEEKASPAFSPGRDVSSEANSLAELPSDSPPPSGETEKAEAHRRESDGPRQWWEIEPETDEISSDNGLTEASAHDEERWNPLQNRDS